MFFAMKVPEITSPFLPHQQHPTIPEQPIQLLVKMYAQFAPQPSSDDFPIEENETWFEDGFFGLPQDDALSTGFSCSSAITAEDEVTFPLQYGGNSNNCSSPQPETKVPNIVTPIPTSTSFSDHENEGHGYRGGRKRTLTVAQFNSIPEKRNFSWSGLKLSKGTVHRLDMKLKLLEKSDCTRPTLAPIAKRARTTTSPPLPNIITVYHSGDTI